LCALVALFCVVVSAELSETEIQTHFMQYVKDYRKSYDYSEFQTRYENFKASLARIAELNTQGGATFGINKFSDMSPAEFSNTVLMKEKIVTQPKANLVVPHVDTSALPAVFDWRDKGAVTPVKDQGQCGSCWAFSATEAIESAWLLGGHAKPDNLALAPQQIVDCDSIDGVQGCNGGDTGPAYEYIIKAGGQEGEKDYPYKAKNGKCAFNSSDVVAKISSHKPGTTDRSEDLLQQNLVSWGPLSICVDASRWQDYQSGTLTHFQCAFLNILDHCVQLVGYNSTASPPHWVVRNSWNTDWGVDGYIYLEMGHDVCGLTAESSWPIL